MFKINSVTINRVSNGLTVEHYDDDEDKTFTYVAENMNRALEVAHKLLEGEGE